MKKIIFLLTFLCVYQLNAQVTLWSNRAGYKQSEVAHSIVTDKYGNSYVTGTFADTTIFGLDTLISRGANDAYLAKIDMDGNWIWAKSIGGASGNEEGMSVTIASNNNIYVGGNFKSSKIFLTSTDSLIQFDPGYQNMFFASYNSSGVLQTKFSNGNFSTDYYLHAFAVTSTGEVIVTGHLVQSTVNYFMFKKFNASGVVQWGGSGETLSQKANGYGNSVFIDNAGTKAYVAGWWSSGFYPSGLSSPRLNQGGIDIFYMAASVSTGQTTSTDFDTYGSTGSDYGKDILVDASNDVYLAAEYGGSMNIGNSTSGGSAVLPAVTKDVVIMKINQTGSWYWYTRGGANSGTTVDKLRQDRFGNIFAHGYSTSSVWSHNGSGVTRTYNVKLSKSYGSILWRSGPSTSVAWYDAGIGIDTIGNVFTHGTFAGTINFGNSNSETSVGANDLYVMKQGSINILYPTEAKIKCSNHNEGDTLKVVAFPSYTLNSGNAYTVEIDTLPSGIFASPVTIGTLVSSSGPANINCILPGYIYTYPSIRVKTSDIANTGEDIFLTTYEKPYLTGPYYLERCLGATSTTITVNSTLPQDVGPFPMNTFSWTPTTSLSTSSPNDYTSYGYTTASSDITYKCTVTNNNGCKDTHNVVINVLPQPSVFAGNDTTLCQGQAEIMSTATASAGVVSYAWTPTVQFTNPTTLNATTTASSSSSVTYTLTVTDTSGCTNNDTKTVTRNPLPTVDAGPTGYTTCSGSSLNLIATGASVASFDWAPPSSLNMSNNDTVVATPPSTTVYTVTATRSNGCIKKDSITITIAPVSVNAGSDKVITCGGSTPITTTVGSGYITPLTYAWFPTTGLSSSTTSTTTANPIATTNYIVAMSTANGCSDQDTVKVTVTEPNYSTNFSASPQLMTSPPFVTQFTNSTPSMSSYNFTWYWGDGTTTASNNTTVFHTYQYNGTYDVTLIAVSIATGCADTLFQGSYIFCTGGTTCTLTASVTAPNGTSGCTGDTVLLAANTGANYTYQWNFNGSPISGATSSTYGAIFPGNYSISINDGSCTVVSQPVSVTFNSAPSTPTITPQGSVSICGSGSVTLQANSGYTSYVWNTGGTSSSIVVNSSGIYSITVSNVAGCTASTSYTLNASSAAAPSICIAGVDSLTGANLVVWNKPVTTDIDSFVIYREGVIANQFDRVGAQDYNSFSTFLDVNSNPQQQFYRYKISLIDTCGTESFMSDYHKTIHLTINAGAGSSWNLLWNYYEGFSVASYNIYRGTAPNNLTLLTTVSGSNNSYTDLTPPGGAVYYQLETIGSNCTPSMKLMNNGHNSVLTTNYNASRSNIVDNGASVNISTTPIFTDLFKIYPNPTDGFINVLFIKATDQKGKTIEILDPLGRLLLTKEIVVNGVNSVERLNVSEFNNGVYFIRVKDLNNEYVVRFVKSN